MGVENVRYTQVRECLIEWTAKKYGLCDVQIQFLFTKTNTTKQLPALNQNFSNCSTTTPTGTTLFRTFVYVQTSFGESVKIGQSVWKDVTKLKEQTTTTAPTTTTKDKWGDLDTEKNDSEGIYFRLLSLVLV